MICASRTITVGTIDTRIPLPAITLFLFLRQEISIPFFSYFFEMQQAVQSVTESVKSGLSTLGITKDLVSGIDVDKINLMRGMHFSTAPDRTLPYR